MNDLTDEAPMPPRLPEEYDGCLLGITVGIGHDHFVYSLRKMILYMQSKDPSAKVEDIRNAIAEMIPAVQRETGLNSPVWVDDELVQGTLEDKPDGPKLVLPGHPAYRHPPRPRG